MTTGNVPTDRTRHTFLRATLGAFSSAFGYYIASLVFSEFSIIQAMQDIVGDPLSQLICGLPVLVGIAFPIILATGEILKNRIPTSVMTWLIIVIGMIIGFILFLPYQLIMLLLYSF